MLKFDNILQFLKIALNLMFLLKKSIQTYWSMIHHFSPMKWIQIKVGDAFWMRLGSLSMGWNAIWVYIAIKSSWAEIWFASKRESLKIWWNSPILYLFAYNAKSFQPTLNHQEMLSNVFGNVYMIILDKKGPRDFFPNNHFFGL